MANTRKSLERVPAISWITEPMPSPCRWANWRRTWPPSIIALKPPSVWILLRQHRAREPGTEIAGGRFWTNLTRTWPPRANCWTAQRTRSSCSPGRCSPRPDRLYMPGVSRCCRANLHSEPHYPPSRAAGRLISGSNDIAVPSIYGPSADEGFDVGTDQGGA